ncbi:nodulin homeobox isoform X2 [Phalaenopsis equestris]|uniref:nodulin homeobox isoform X2 n=1 Tax=Phalaenopsis equestris TaxID=78828 RepID=UPI0009E200DB|nr:nodulin homeobox isoform X2 [Phalaenopsis equestris]
MFDLISAIEELSGIPPKEITKLLKETDTFTIQFNDSRGCSRQIDLEGLASSLPLHIIAVLLSNGRGENFLHLLHGIRLLYSFSDLATRHSRLEQILLDDVKLCEQVMDLVIFMLIVLAQCDQDNHVGSSLPVIHAALVACSFHLLTGYISSQWQDVANVMLAHPKVDIFMDVAFDSVQETFRLLRMKLSMLNHNVLCNSLSISIAERTASFIFQQCEVSLQYLLFLCQQKVFRDRLLKNKELCKNGGILSLTCTILKLTTPDCFKESLDVLAAISRLKSRILSILLQLCEAENFSYLDEVAGSQKCLHLAKSITIQILDILKVGFKREAIEVSDSVGRRYPKGFLLLNSLRLADIFSDDSNFRSFFMANAIHVLNELLAVPHQVFLSNWCTVDAHLSEEDGNLEYDPFIAASLALVLQSGSPESILSSVSQPSEINFSFHSNFNGFHLVTYGQQRTSYLIKIVANLHCFVPSFCEEEERNLFLKKFHESLLMETTDSLLHPVDVNTHKAATICENLSSLSNYGASLIPNMLNDEDVQLLRVFTEQLKKLTLPNSDNRAQETIQTEGGKMQVDGNNPMQQSLPTWVKFANENLNKNHQDAQNGVGRPYLLVKADPKVHDDVSDIKGNNIDIKGGTPLSSSSLELEPLLGTDQRLQKKLVFKKRRKLKAFMVKRSSQERENVIS